MDWEGGAVMAALPLFPLGLVAEGDGFDLRTPRWPERPSRLYPATTQPPSTWIT
jgi:hypothetical protein